MKERNIRSPKTRHYCNLPCLCPIGQYSIPCLLLVNKEYETIHHKRNTTKKTQISSKWMHETVLIHEDYKYVPPKNKRIQHKIKYIPSKNIYLGITHLWFELLDFMIHLCFSLKTFDIFRVLRGLQRYDRNLLATNPSFHKDKEKAQYAPLLASKLICEYFEIAMPCIIT